MPLKYQSEIDNLEFVIECPNNISPIEKEVVVFRFSYTPIDHELNFLPNVVFDRLNGGGYDYSSKTDELGKCRRCGASFYYNDVMAVGAWKSMPHKRKEKLKYTHLAKGIFSPGDGLVTSPDDYSHFGFYEAVNANEDYLKTKFELVDKL